MNPSASDDKGQRVVPAGRVRDSGVRVKLSIPGHEAAAAEPVLEVIREGGVVRAIDILCSCGRRIRVVCDYEEAAGGQP